MRPAGVARRVGKAAFWIWAVAVLLGGATLTAAHSYTLPRPAEAEIAPPLAALQRQLGAKWLAVHVLYASCRCSLRIRDELAARGPTPGVREVVLLVGGDSDWKQPLVDAGYTLQPATADQLRDVWHIEAAPMLLVLGPDSRIGYRGGYTEHQQGGTDPQDARIIAAAMAADPPPAVPLFGCAVSKRLQRMLDPLGLKYGD